MDEFTAEDRAALRRLLDEAACRTLVERYAYAVDWMNWPGLEALFWSDAQFDFGMWSGDLAAYLPWVAALEQGYARRLHMFAIPRLEIDGDGGRAEVGVGMFVRSIDDAGAGQDDLMFGRYQFRFARREGQWRITSLHFLMHGAHRFAATDQGGSPLFADGLDPSHPLFAQ